MKLYDAKTMGFENFKSAMFKIDTSILRLRFYDLICPGANGHLYDNRLSIMRIDYGRECSCRCSIPNQNTDR
jgi:hypothetical protein